MSRRNSQNQGLEALANVVIVDPVDNVPTDVATAAPPSDATDAPPTGKPTVDASTPAGKLISLADLKFVGMTGGQLLAAKTYMPDDVFAATFKTAWDAYQVAELAQAADAARASDLAAIMPLLEASQPCTAAKCAMLASRADYLHQVNERAALDKRIKETVDAFGKHLAELVGLAKPLGVDVVPAERVCAEPTYQSPGFTAKYGVAAPVAAKSASNGKTNGTSANEDLLKIIVDAGAPGIKAGVAIAKFRTVRSLPATANYSVGAVCANEKASGAIVQINGLWFAKINLVA